MLAVFKPPLQDDEKVIVIAIVWCEAHPSRGQNLTAN